MKRWNMLALADRSSGYLRKDYREDVLYSFYRYRDVDLTVGRQNAVHASDALAERMLREGLVHLQQVARYRERLIQELLPPEKIDLWSAERIYSHIHQVRREVFGADALEKVRELQAEEGCDFDARGGIDQKEIMDALLEKAEGVLFVLAQAELFSLMRRDLDVTRGKKCFVAVSEAPGELLPTASFFRSRLPGREISYRAGGEDLPENTLVLFYGEDGLLHCRGLNRDAVVTAIPRGYLAQALTNQLGMVRGCRVYVPRGLDLTPWVPLDRQTRVSYWHLAGLSEAYGLDVYRKTPSQLYAEYPRWFLNVYENREAGAPLPIFLEQGIEDFSQFDGLRERAIQKYLDRFSNISYFSAYFDEQLTQTPICYDSGTKQPGILVHGVRIRRSKESRVIRLPNGVSPRQYFREKNLPGTGIVSNFLFFMTGKLGHLYNHLRADRPLEQADAASGHLDYMLCYREGKRVETFPLFRKMCIAMDKDGRFLFFNFGLRGGRVTAGTQTYEWTADRVNTEDPQAPVLVYTPYGSREDREENRETYRKAVGAGRVNLVVLQDRIVCVRAGDVILPSAGVVISLREDRAKDLLAKLQPLQEGYYDVSGLELTTELDPPEGIPPETWAGVRWAFGGGLSLMMDGKAICDGEMEPWFDREGWMSPLSRQTQESALHLPAKHPRTAIGTTADGDLVILVFSGRTWRSSGADYSQMCHIARTLVPDIRHLMNADGGGSAMLGLTADGNFLELSCPSTSDNSTVGMVRLVNTIFYIPVEHREDAE